VFEKPEIAELVAGEKWAFWLLLLVIGFVEVMAFIASAEVGHARWQVNVLEHFLRRRYGCDWLHPFQAMNLSGAQIAGARRLRGQGDSHHPRIAKVSG
jgi:hypothetical protein